MAIKPILSTNTVKSTPADYAKRRESARRLEAAMLELEQERKLSQSRRATADAAVEMSLARAKSQIDTEKIISPGTAVADAKRTVDLAARKPAQELAARLRRANPLEPPLPPAPVEPQLFPSRQNTENEVESYLAEQEALVNARINQYSGDIRQQAQAEPGYNERLNSEYYNTYHAQETAATHYNPNFKLFMAASPSVRRRIFDQRATNIGNMRFGVSTVAKAGCGAVAVYNVLRDLQQDVSLAGVIREAEEEGLMELGGWFGIMPANVSKLLDCYDVKHRQVNPYEVLRGEQSGQLVPGTKYIVSAWNDVNSLSAGIHTFEMLYDPATPGLPWAAYNLYPKSVAPNRLRSFSDALRASNKAGDLIVGQFITVYEIGE